MHLTTRCRFIAQLKFLERSFQKQVDFNYHMQRPIIPTSFPLVDNSRSPDNWSFSIKKTWCDFNLGCDPTPKADSHFPTQKSLANSLGWVSTHKFSYDRFCWRSNKHEKFRVWILLGKTWVVYYVTFSGLHLQKSTKIKGANGMSIRDYQRFAKSPCAFPQKTKKNITTGDGKRPFSHKHMSKGENPCDI